MKKNQSQSNEVSTNEKITQTKQKNKMTKKQKVILAISIILLIILVAFICFEIALIVDFYQYKDTSIDGHLWTVAQRQNGLFGWFYTK